MEDHQLDQVVRMHLVGSKDPSSMKVFCKQVICLSGLSSDHSGRDQLLRAHSSASMGSVTYHLDHIAIQGSRVRLALSHVAL